MNGCLRGDVTEGNPLIPFGDDVGADFARRDFFKRVMGDEGWEVKKLNG